MINEYDIICKKCGKKFKIKCSDNNFKKGRYKKYCSRSCANSHNISQETKNKISNSLKKISYTKYNNCNICGSIFKQINGKPKCYCSNKCKQISKYINTLIKYFNFDKTTIGTEHVFDEINNIREILFNEYWNNNLTGIELGKKFNYPSPCNITGKIFKYLNIPTRSCKDTNLLNILKCKTLSVYNTKYKQGWHTTWNNKQVYLRSSYEFDYANELDKQNVDYDVECLRIKYFDSLRNEYRCAIPDFYLKDSNTIVEIKSNYTYNEQNMKDRFDEYKKLGYNVKLILEHNEINL